MTYTSTSKGHIQHHCYEGYHRWNRRFSSEEPDFTTNYISMGRFFMLKSQITEVAEIFQTVILSFISVSHNNYKISRGIL
jgi:hypothetical protein